MCLDQSGQMAVTWALEGQYYHCHCFVFVEIAEQGAKAKTFYNVVTTSRCSEPESDVFTSSQPVKRDRLSHFVRVQRLQDGPKLDGTKPMHVSTKGSFLQ